MKIFSLPIYKNFWKLALCLGIVFVYLFSLSPGVWAGQLSATDQQAIFDDTGFYDPVASGCSNTIGVSLASANGDKTIWNSGLQPPYILEQWAIETLKDLASKTGKSTSDTVTQEHVLGLVSWAWKEGGDIYNPNTTFNPVNTGIDDPSLVEGGHSASGVQAFKSFDAGVEGVTRTFVGSNQNRMGGVLTDPSTTAEQVVTVAAEYFNYPGNLPWAYGGFSQPDDLKRFNETDYLPSLLSFVQQTRGRYDQAASVVIGTPDKEAVLNLTHPELLQFHISGTGSSASGADATINNCPTTGGVVAGSVIKTALGLAWDTGGHGPNRSDATPQYIEAKDKFNPTAVGDDEYSDCGVFVATVMHASGADSNYPARGTGPQLAYLESHPEKYQNLGNVSSTASLKPGDIFIYDAGSAGHTYIFVGPQTGSAQNNYDSTSASLHDHVPQAANVEFISNGHSFSVFRLIK